MATFEEQIGELETIVARLEQGNLSLEESVALFERGMLLSNACKRILVDADRRIRVLIDPEEDGPVRSSEMAVEVAEDEDDEDEDLDDGRL